MIQFIAQEPGADEFAVDILSGEYYIVGDSEIKFRSLNIGDEWYIFVGPRVTNRDITQFWIRIDGIDYKVEPADTVESYLNRIRVPLHNAIMNDTLDELD